MSVGENIHPEEAIQDIGTIPQPVEVRSDNALIENVYADASGQHDYASTAAGEAYLNSRFTVDPTTARTIVRRSLRLSYPALVTGPDEIVERWRRTDAWLVSPRVAAGITLGSAVLANVVPLAQTGIGLTEQASHAVYRLFNPLQDTVEKRITGSVDKDITVAINSSNSVGEAEVRHQAVTEFSDLVHDTEKHGATIRKIVVEGESSDDFNGDESMMRVDAGNTIIETRRATVTADALQQIMGKNIPVAIEVTHKENVITAEERDAVLAQAQAAGYTTISEAVNAVDAGQDVQPELADTINKLFISKRGATMRATVTEPGQEITTEVHTKEQDNPPTMPDVEWFPVLVPVLAIRKREKLPVLQGTKYWMKKTKELFLKPKIIEENLNTAWVRVRPEAVQEDQTLVEHPWAYTRKYEALLREDRIKDVMRADFQVPSKDESSDTPVDASLRIMFVDHSPADETVEAFTKLLGQFANIQDGALANKITGIFVYPASNAGLSHGEPKKVGLGVDKQSKENVLGTCTPLLELVEMHMDNNLSADELLQSFTDTEGGLWTLAHEVAGHGSDISDTKSRVEPVRARGIDNAHLVTGDSWADHMSKLRGTLRSIVEQRKEELPVQFDISYSMLDANGEEVTVTDRVYEGDKRLAFARKATIVGVEHTHYSAADPSEHYAEAAAAVTTGIVVPFSEAAAYVPKLTTDQGTIVARHTNGYRPAQNAQAVFTSSVGAEETSYPATFARPTETTVVMVKPEDDPLMRQHLVRARQMQFASPEGMVAILTKVVS